MEKDEKLELVNLAIQKLLEEKSSKQVEDDDDDEQLLLFKLLSQLESLEGNDVLKPHEASNELEQVTSSAVGKADAKSENPGILEDGSSAKVVTKDIVKELKKVERQNTITHWLLSAMIVLTVAWQLSEVSLILRVKNRLSHPFRFFGSMLAGTLKGSGTNGQNGDKESSSEHHHLMESPSLSSLKMPELPHLELPDLSSNGE